MITALTATATKHKFTFYRFPISLTQRRSPFIIISSPSLSSASTVVAPSVLCSLAIAVPCQFQRPGCGYGFQRGSDFHRFESLIATSGIPIPSASATMTRFCGSRRGMRPFAFTASAFDAEFTPLRQVYGDVGGSGGPSMAKETVSVPAVPVMVAESAGCLILEGAFPRIA
jgi:hypothetical protein